MTDDWFEQLIALLDTGSRFVVVGAHALAVHGVPDFATAWAARVEHPVRGRTIPFLGRATFIDNKRASARLKDLADIEALGEDPNRP